VSGNLLFWDGILSIRISGLTYDLQGISSGSMSFKLDTEITEAAKSGIDVAELACNSFGISERVSKILKYLKCVQTVGSVIAKVDIVAFE
jgi:hypothetical protein